MNEWFFERRNSMSRKVIEGCYYDFSQSVNQAQLSLEAEEFLRNKRLLVDPARLAKAAQQEVKDLDDSEDNNCTMGFCS